MAYALVVLQEPRATGWRIAQVCAAPFPVADGLVWHEVPNNVTENDWFWDGSTAQPVPAVIVMPGTAAAHGPSVIG